MLIMSRKTSDTCERRRSSGSDGAKEQEPIVGALNIGLLIYEAAKQGSLENLIYALDRKGAKDHVNYRDRNTQMTPLMVAAMFGHLNCVKLLLCHSADIHATIPPPKYRTQRQTAADLAAKSAHTRVSKYLHSCIDDLVNISTTRAHMEADVIAIASNPKCSIRDADQFCFLVRQLQEKCGYQLEGDSDDGEPTLLIRAAKANNSYIIYKLVEEFDVQLFAGHPDTAENVLHFACEHMSAVRFYLTKKCEGLLLIPDQKGNSPLHIACAKNDITFVSWLFNSILKKEGEGEKEEKNPSDLTFSGSLHRVSSLPYMTLPINTSPVLSLAAARMGRMARSVHVKRQLYSASRPRNHRIVGMGPREERERSLELVENGDIPAHNSELSRDRERGGDGGYATAPSEGSASHASSPPSSPIELDDFVGSPIDFTTASICTSGSSRTLVFEGSTFSTNSAQSDVLAESDYLEPCPESPLSPTFISDMKLLRKNTEGESILHVLASEGHLELLKKILKVVEILQHSLEPSELDVLTTRDGFTRQTPIEVGILKGNLGCVRALIKFVEKTDQIKKLFSDDKLLKIAVFSGNIDALKLLVEFGFHLGIAKAITLADMEHHDMLRFLLYYQTEIVNALEFSTAHPSRAVTLKTGGVKWEGVNLQHLKKEWLYDTYSAVDFVSCVFNNPKAQVLDSSRYSREFFKQLGANCLDYFSSVVPTPSSLPPSLTSLSRYHLVPILEVNLMENQLQSVPSELFQMPHLRVLKLSHNDLQKLPSSEAPNEVLYSSSKLRRLLLDWNKLKTLPEDLCQGLGNSLDELNVSFNKLAELPPGLWAMRKLKKLTLSHNKLSHLHVFSNPHYFFDAERTRRVVTSFEATPSGQLRCVEDRATVEHHKELLEVEQYLLRLASFIKTVRVVHEESSTISAVQTAIDVHWQRYRQLDNYPNSPTRTQCTKVESLDSGDEDEGRMLIQTGLCEALQYLDLSDNDFRELPWDLPCVAPNVHRVDLRNNEITDLDIIHTCPPNVSTLWLSDNKIANTMKLRSPTLPCGSLLLLLSTQPERTNNYCSHCHRSRLEQLTNLALDHNRLTSFEVVKPMLGSCEDLPDNISSSYDSIVLEPLFPRLSVLSLSHNLLKQVPGRLYKLLSLSSLSLSFNPITELPEELGKINPHILLNLQLEGLFLRNIPQSEVEGGNWRSIISYLKSIREKSRTYRRMKLMVVGEANKGKTSLLLSLTRRGRVTRFKEVAMDRHKEPLATNGVELGDWEYAPGRKEKVTFMTWDFGGQEEYYATHQVFLTNRSLFLLVWNITDGEEGLCRLRPWLEKIEGRAKDSPVVVVATHADGLPSNSRDQTIFQLEKQFKELYINSTNRFAFPRVHPQLQVVNCKDSRQVDKLRDFIYDFVVKFKPPSPRFCNHAEVEPLLQQKIPEAYIKLQDTVRQLAQMCSQQNRVPIFTRKEYVSMVHDAGTFFGSKEELDQATNFLHSNGILLHFDESQLSHLYFLNPQWLCSMLADVITIRERNPHIRDGIINMDNLHQILHTLTPSLQVESELISLMQRFEVMLKLDSERLLIPSLLPREEKNAYVILPQSVQLEDECGSSTLADLRGHPRAPIASLPDVMVRYYLLPFIPDGFFSHLIARILSSDIASRMREALSVGPLESHHILNTVRWDCWRDGISLIWNHMEIIRIAPLSSPLQGAKDVCIISSLGQESRDSLKGVEVKIAFLPEEQLRQCSFLGPHMREEGCHKNRCMATWLLHQATDLADSVFDDWYEAFGRKRNFDYTLNCMASPCPQCFKHCRWAELSQKTTPTFRRLTFSSFLGLSDASSPVEREGETLYLFSSSFCCHVLTQGGKVKCPSHGDMEVATVAPDLVFADFAPSTLFPDPSVLHTLQRLGDGGFGTVSLGLLSKGTQTVKVAVKEFKAEMAAMNCRLPELEGETRSWEIYQAASVEGRMMRQLNHAHILALVGVTFRPIRLLLELAPKGDLRKCIRQYQKAGIRLNRWTLKATMIQVAEALDYLHSKNIIYRDLKPANVLVWRYPHPREQWNPDTAVHLKLADYGISKQISPQGIRGQEGTPQYLPPEVILHGGQESYSFKVDVYSFGMFMYFLFSFKNPFDKEMLIASLLRDGRRPELPTKLWPHSIQMLELMCWCWSERPNHRPTFQQVLSILRSDTSTSLVGGTPVSRDDDDIHAAYVKSVQIPARRSSAFGSAVLSHSSASCCQRMSDLLPASHSGIGMETAVEVWYATVSGSLSVVQYHSGGACLEHINHPSQKYISSILFAGGHMWVGSVSSGLWVYDPTSKQPVAMWGEIEKRTVFQLINVEDTFSVLALTRSGLHLFSTSTLCECSSSAVQVLVPVHHSPYTGQDINQGAYIPRCGNLTVPELWVCPQNGHHFQVLSPADLSLREKVEMPKSEGKKIRHMQPMLVQEECCLFVADRHILQKWDVLSRVRLTEVDCHAVSQSPGPGQPRSPLKHGRITSLAVGTNTVYVGTGGGVILVISALTMEVGYRLEAYTMPVRCLFVVKHMKPFSRMVSTVEATVSHSTSTNQSLASLSSSASCASLTSTDSSTSLRSVEQDCIPPDNKCILMSFGLGYRGVVETCKNCPESFVLPYGYSPCSCCNHFFTKSRPSPNTGYLLLWSTENGRTRGHDLTYEDTCTGEDHLDGSSE